MDVLQRAGMRLVLHGLAMRSIIAHPCAASIACSCLLRPPSSPPRQIWDMFVRCSDASLGFEDRFAIFCDQVGAGAARRRAGQDGHRAAAGRQQRSDRNSLDRRCQHSLPVATLAAALPLPCRRTRAPSSTLPPLSAAGRLPGGPGAARGGRAGALLPAGRRGAGGACPGASRLAACCRSAYRSPVLEQAVCGRRVPPQAAGRCSRRRRRRCCWVHFLLFFITLFF